MRLPLDGEQILMGQRGSARTGPWTALGLRGQANPLLLQFQGYNGDPGIGGAELRRPERPPDLAFADQRTIALDYSPDSRAQQFPKFEPRKIGPELDLWATWDKYSPRLKPATRKRWRSVMRCGKALWLRPRHFEF